ncbi:MAG: PH domain-containing protein [Actinobacteria bacterium]|nr:PH domain-containing protein [Actinomycetota bacterium]
MPRELHQGEHVIFEGHPSWRSTLSFYLRWALLAVVPPIVAVLAGVSVADGVGIYLALVILIVLTGWLLRLATRYTITNQRLTIRRGVLAKHVQETRIERVQNVNTDQSFLDRMLNVGKVDFDTAGTDDSDFTFHGVADPARVVRAVDDAHRQREAAVRDQAAGGF